MKIYCIVLTKNEADIIGLCLERAAKWADYIYVYDGASTDETWEIVKSLGSTTIMPWKQDGKVFSEGLRAEVFNEFRQLSAEGDWWLQLNADEFHLSNLRATLGSIPDGHNFVWGIPIEYYITRDDLRNVDFTLPIGQRLPLLRHYKINWAEPRCFRYRRRIVWKNDNAWPYHAGIVARQRIYFRHYPYRSPRQIQMRLDTRRDNRSRGFAGWVHASQLSWIDKIVEARECHLDEGSGEYVTDEAVLPRHTESAPRRFMKAFMHRSGIWP